MERGQPPRDIDVLLVSLGSTAGLRAADEELRQGLRRAGATVEVARAVEPAPVRTLMLTDLGWARAARSAARAALARPGMAPRAVIYSTTTAALLWPRAGAVRFDAPSAANRRGRHGLWQRPLERLRLRRAPLLLPSSSGALAELPPGVERARALIVPVPVEPSGEAARTRDIAAITYGANPTKKGLDRVLAAWRAVRASSAAAGGELVIAGVPAGELERSGLVGRGEPGVRLAGVLEPEEYRALLRRSRVFVCAPRREDYGVAQLEALADGCQLVTTAAPGPYVALPIARSLDPRLVSDDLAGALRVALEHPLRDYGVRARAQLAPFTRAAVDELIAAQLLARLLV